MTDMELKELMANLVKSQQQTDKRLEEVGHYLEGIGKYLEESRKEADRRFQETEEQFKETDRRFKETDRRLKELAKQIGGLGNKFGSFTEGMAFPALDKLLRQRFKMEVVTTRTRAKQNGTMMEIDVLGYASDKIFIVEVKSHLRSEDLEQIIQILTDFPQFFPQQANRPRYGILAAIDISENLKKQVLKNGIYLATIHDDQFVIQVPKTFQAQAFL